MRRPATLLTAAVLGASALTFAVPSPATAASTTVGNGCVATAPAANYTIVMTARSVLNPLPVAAPSGGVIVKAQISMPAVGSPYPNAVKVMRATGVANQYTVVAQSAPLPANGITTFDVRLPIAAGDVLGLYGGATGTLYCSTPDAGDTVGVIVGDQAPGTTATYAPATGIALPVVVTVEPDADKDGYGDETQDQCPQLASTQSACPVVKVDSSASLAGNKIKVVLTTDNPATVKVTGIAKANGKKFKLKGGTKAVSAGVLTTFKVKLPKGLKAALAKLPHTKSIKVTLTSSATDSLGRVTTDKTKVKVPGTHR